MISGSYGTLSFIGNFLTEDIQYYLRLSKHWKLHHLQAYIRRVENDWWSTHFLTAKKLIERKEGTAETLESPPPLRLGLTLPVNTTWDAMLAGSRSVKTWNCEWVLMKQTPLDPHSHSVFSPQHDPKQFTSPIKEFYLLDTLAEPSTKEHTTVILRMLPPVNFWTAF